MNLLYYINSYLLLLVISPITIKVLAPFYIPYRKLFVFSLIYFISGTLAILFVNYPILPYIPLIALSCLYLYILSGKKWFSIIIFFVSYIICALCFNILEFIFKSLNPELTTVSLITSLPYFIPYFMVSAATSLLLSYIIGKVINKVFGSTDKNTLPLSVIILIFVTLLLSGSIFLCNIILGYKIGYNTTLLGFNCILFLLQFIISILILVISLKIFNSVHKKTLQVVQYDNLQEYTTKIEAMYSTLRTFKHDYINIMTSMSCYIDEKNYEELTIYFTEQIMPISYKLSENKFNLNQLMNIKILEIKGLISSKLIFANELGVSVNIEIFEPITDVYINSVDFARVIGIYLDNAIEASIETTVPIINFCIILNDYSISVIISNSFIDRKIPIAKMTKLSFSTKGTNRGIGLYNVSEILNKYLYVVNETYFENELFTQHLEISRN